MIHDPQTPWRGHASDNLAYRFPVSIKGVVLMEGSLPLLRNEREEWELPGGKLELGESPEACCEREIEEELSIRVRVDRLVDTWVYTIDPGTHVLIVTFGCICLDASAMRLSHEHKELAVFPTKSVGSLVMPDGYKRSIAAWDRLARGDR